MHSTRIPEGWSYWTSEQGTDDDAWRMAIRLKHRREELRRDLLVRIRVIRGPGCWWILRREEMRQETGT